MIIQVLHYPHCEGADIVRHGKTRQGKQRYRCRAEGCAARIGKNGEDNRLISLVKTHFFQELRSLQKIKLLKSRYSEWGDDRPIDADMLVKWYCQINSL